MPELPEVEIVVRGLRSYLEGRSIQSVHLFHTQLRHKLDQDLTTRLPGQSILGIERRAKYIFMQLSDTNLVVHLGMSGKLVGKPADYIKQKHDHIVIELDNGEMLVYNDPRRFGMFYMSKDAPSAHLANLGPEPLGDWDAQQLYTQSRGKKQAIKSFIMDQKVVVGVGNIYACEALFHSHIHPLTPAKDIDMAACKDLVSAIKATLSSAINQGGSTLKDFRGADDNLGYFQQSLYVYGQKGKACQTCGAEIEMLKVSGRSTFFCAQCQPLYETDRDVQ